MQPPDAVSLADSCARGAQSTRDPRPADAALMVEGTFASRVGEQIAEGGRVDRSHAIERCQDEQSTVRRRSCVGRSTGPLQRRRICAIRLRIQPLLGRGKLSEWPVVTLEKVDSFSLARIAKVRRWGASERDRDACR